MTRISFKSKDTPGKRPAALKADDWPPDDGPLDLVNPAVVAEIDWALQIDRVCFNRQRLSKVGQQKLALAKEILIGYGIYW